ncbi:MAG TPA: protein kinase [Anaeromyxobacter sp.]|nr:protein kinase [Anaeromyxobacter sp.]
MQLSALLADMVRAQEIAVDAWSPDLQPGGAVGRFKLVRELGRGGFGVVYEAADGDLGRTVALKVVRAGTRIANRGSQWLLREAEAVARLNHPNIVTLHDLGQAPSGPYLVFELLRGQSLAEKLRAGPLPVDEVIDVGIAVARALVHAHGAGVIHRDLTAANVHLTEDGGIKVLDFGLAHLFGRDGANDGGTPAYMAPEQWEGDQGDARTDLFALGVILFQALTGQFPYRVDRGWSEALEPGETPRVPRRDAPRALRRLVRSLLDREPELRPETARAVRDALLALRAQRGNRVRRRVLWGAVGTAAAAVAAAVWIYFQREPPPGEQVRVVLAEMETAAGEPSLEAVPGLLAAALEPSRRVKVVPESRLGYLSRQAGLGEPGRIDAARGRELARLAGAAALLVPTAWQEDGNFVVGVHAIEAETGRTMFRNSAPVVASGGLQGAVDALSDRIRRELNERSEDRRIRRPVAVAVTASPEAARFYYDGVDCVARPVARRGTVQQCRGLFERALALDPSFPLAHYQLAAIEFLPGSPGEASKPHLRAAQEALARLPPREAALVRALSARIDGRRADAARIYDELLAAAPEDPEALAGAAAVHAERTDWASAARYLEKLVAVRPDDDLPLDLLIAALGRTNRVDDLGAIRARLEAEGSGRARLLVDTLVWAGDSAAAVRVARAAVRERGDGERGTLRYALQAAGEYREMEAVARAEVEEEPTSVQTRFHVDMALTAQGRVTEALRWLEETIRMSPAQDREEIAYRQAMIAAATGDPARIWRYAAPAHASGGRRATASLALVFLLLGDVEHADELGASLDPGSPEDLQFRALRSWRAGDAASALAQLAHAEGQDPLPSSGLAPAYLAAEVAAATGDDVTVVAMVDRFQRLPPHRIWRAWAYPRSLYLAARAHARLGDRDAARRAVDRLLGLLGRADRDVVLLKQARLLRGELQ